MVVVIDSQVAGISGDMLLCALVDLGASKSKILAGIRAAQKHISGCTIHRLDFIKKHKRGINATCLVLEMQDVHERPGIEIRDCLEKSLVGLDVSDKAAKFTMNCINTLIGAESKIHGIPADSVHFHEAASMDTIIDILGCAIALDDLGMFDDEIISTTVAVGGGTVDFSHGRHSNPAPAILDILQDSGIQIRGGPVDAELTTPTGACLLACLAPSHKEFYPPLGIESVGYGGGTKDFEPFANVLKIVTGSAVMQTDSVVVLETNIDDVSGEVMGFLIDKIIDGGAMDVSISHTTTKKNRPASLVTVICTDEMADKITRILFDETGTLGVRIRHSERLTWPRKIRTEHVTINGVEFDIRLKVNPSTGKLFKVEFGDIRMVSERLGLPLRDAEELIRSAIWT